MKRFFILSLFLTATSGICFAQQQSTIDSIRRQLQFISNDSLRAPVFTAIANEYLKYDSLSNRDRKRIYQNEAINNTMIALHFYSRYSDTLGMRTCFDALSKVYTSQRKFAEAKWFSLQSITISRGRKDTASLIPGLINLASIKSQVKDYKLAMKDLNEALTMSQKTRSLPMEAAVQKNYAFLYNRMEDFEKGEIALKKSQSILETIKKAEDDKLTAEAQGTPLSTAKANMPAIKKKIAAAPRKVQKRLPAKKMVAAL